MGIHLPRVKFSTTLFIIFTIFIPDSASHPLFPEPLIEEKLSLQKSLEEVMRPKNNLKAWWPHHVHKIFKIHIVLFQNHSKKIIVEKIMKFVQETERIIQNVIKFPCPSDVHMTQESCHFENPASISSYQPELDQH